MNGFSESPTGEIVFPSKSRSPSRVTSLPSKLSPLLTRFAKLSHWASVVITRASSCSSAAEIRSFCAFEISFLEAFSSASTFRALFASLSQTARVPYFARVLSSELLSGFAISSV